MSDSALETRLLLAVMQSLIVPLFIIGFAFVFVAMRKPPKGKPRRIKSFTTALGSTEVAKHIVNYARQNNMKFDEFDKENGRIVVSQPPTLTSWGFFYPVFLSTDEKNHTVVEVGIWSKLIQFGPITTRFHERFYNGIRAEIFSSM
jgi:hypothetical protein